MHTVIGGSILNPYHAYTARVVLLGLCVRVSDTHFLRSYTLKQRYTNGFGMVQIIIRRDFTINASFKGYRALQDLLTVQVYRVGALNATYMKYELL